jgi:hypothetical protein
MAPIDGVAVIEGPKNGPRWTRAGEKDYGFQGGARNPTTPANFL